MRKEDIVVDGLVATVGANPKASLETLETIRYCKSNGFATICGLSNISFAMPERGFVNTAFLTLAIQSGLTLAIANPSEVMLMSCALAQRFAPGTPFFHRLIIGYDVTAELIGITIARPGYLSPIYTYGAIALAAQAWA